MRDRFCQFLLCVLPQLDHQYLFLAICADEGLGTASLWWLTGGADGWTEGLGRVGHEGFDLLHGARDAGQQLHPLRRHRDVIFDANLCTKEQCFNGVTQTGCIHTASSGSEELKGENGTGKKRLCQWIKGNNWNIYQNVQEVLQERIKKKKKNSSTAVFIRKGCTWEKKIVRCNYTKVSFLQKLHKQRPILYQFSTFSGLIFKNDSLN